jgi:DNA-binding NarL/FixJ family response regulator
MTPILEANPDSAAKKRRIFIVDDHPLVREWLTNLINQQPDLVVCGEAETAVEAREAMKARQPDAAVIDLSLKDSSGIELIKELKRNCPKLAVIVLSMHEESHYAQRALLAGARAYVMKRETTKRIIAAIRDVMEGKLFLSESVAKDVIEQLVTAHGSDRRSTVASLSDREMQVFELLGKAWSTRRIAEALGITMKTVQAYCARIKEKLHLQNATELLREAVRFHDGAEK